MASADGRSKNWEIVIWMESVVSNWREILDSLQIPYVVSPVHEFDVIEETGELKKPHRHINLFYPGTQSEDTIAALADSLNAHNQHRAITNQRGAIRYTVHIDYPNKYQYSIDDIIAVGIDIYPFFQDKAARYLLIKEMMDYIRDHYITEFQDLMDYASRERFLDWFPALCDNSAYVIGQYIKSQRHRPIDLAGSSNGRTSDSQSEN